MNGKEALKDIKNCLFWSDSGLEKINIIEKELKDYEETKQDLEQVMKDYQDLGNRVYKELKALEIISQNFKLVGNCLHAKNKYAESGWVFVKELENEEEHNAWKEVLL